MGKKTYIPRDNHMRIRVIEPNDELWLLLVKKGGKYYAAMPKDVNAIKFSTLDIGKKKRQPEKKARGIWMIRGVLEGADIEPGDPVKGINWTTQSIRVEYAAFDSSADDSPATKIRKLKTSKYWEIIKNFLNKEYDDKIKSINVIQKEDDFSLDMTFLDVKSHQKKKK